MMGPTHRVLGALAGAGWGVTTHQSWTVTAIGTLIATATSNGPTSPDGDQSEVWRTIMRVTPNWIAPDWVRRHRGMSHWWGLPALAWLAVWHFLDHQTAWAGYALVVGWASHLVGDAVFGRVPLLPWGVKVGLTFDTGGRVEKVLMPLLGVATGWVLYTSLRGAL